MPSIQASERYPNLGFIGGVMVSVLASSPFDRGVESSTGETKVNEIGIDCFFFSKHAALRRKSKHRLARNQGPC
jgi:hypothetical protein